MNTVPPKRIYRESSLWGLVIVLTCVGIWSGCRTVPETGRRQLVMPEQWEISMGVSAYEELMAAETPSRNQHNRELVQRVGERIAAVAGRSDYQWEFRLIESEQMNAFALPGGKVAVYEGILPICQNEAGLAVVMSHEIAHALARHGGERMSQSYLVKGGEFLLDAVTQDTKDEQRKLLMNAYGVGAQYGVLLPYSRAHESEADAMGIKLMAAAGYDPSEAPTFWERFASAKTGEQTPEFLSTHPSDATRAAALREQLPEALAKYEAAPTKYSLGEMVDLSGFRGSVQQASGSTSGAAR